MFTMKIFPVLLLSLVALVGCRSDDSDKAPDTNYPCICGTPEASVKQCLHPLCLNGEGNPDNPDCVCGTLSIDE